MKDLVSLWPQEHVSRDCLATISMDLTAPFLSDMGLCMEGTGALRAAFRKKIDEAPWVLSPGGTAQADKAKWLDDLEVLLRGSVPDGVRLHFWEWVRDTYTFVPADRPNWEMYEMFFFEWSVGMRSGEDALGCFADPRATYEAYYAFVPSRRLKQRIEESRHRKLSAWDERIFSLCGYTLSEEEVDCDTIFEPFGLVDATANRNYFQQFWDYLIPLLSKDELERLFHTVRRYDMKMNNRLPNLVPPADLRRNIR
jgi:hypothetical protein